ncbi:MAG: hypothetical protein ACRD3P_09450 [Terriglobales bacterium]
MKWSAVFAVTILAVFFLCLPITSYSEPEARVLPRTLDQLADESETIVHGYIVSTQFEPHPQLKNLMTVVVTMTVTETYKGAKRTSLVFRQYALDAGQMRGSSGYSKAQEVILFLRPISQYGLTSPAGLEQGRFNVLTDRRTGQKVAVNGRANAGLFKHFEEHAIARNLTLSPRLKNIVNAPTSGPVPLKDLKMMINGLVGAK